MNSLLIKLFNDMTRRWRQQTCFTALFQVNPNEPVTATTKLFWNIKTFVPSALLHRQVQIQINHNTCFNSQFPGQPGQVSPQCQTILGFAVARNGSDCSDNWNSKMCKAGVKSPPQTFQHSVFTGWIPFLSPNQQQQSMKGTKSNLTLHRNLLFIHILSEHVLCF